MGGVRGSWWGKTSLKPRRRWHAALDMLITIKNYLLITCYPQTIARDQTKWTDFATRTRAWCIWYIRKRQSGDNQDTCNRVWDTTCQSLFLVGQSASHSFTVLRCDPGHHQIQTLWLLACIHYHGQPHRIWNCWKWEMWACQCLKRGMERQPHGERQ